MPLRVMPDYRCPHCGAVTPRQDPVAGLSLFDYAAIAGWISDALNATQANPPGKPPGEAFPARGFRSDYSDLA